MESCEIKATENDGNESENISSEGMLYETKKSSTPVRKKSLRQSTLSAPNYHLQSASSFQYIMAKVKCHKRYKKISQKRKYTIPNHERSYSAQIISKITHPQNVFDFTFLQKYAEKETTFEDLKNVLVNKRDKRKIIGLRILPDNKIHHLTNTC